MISRGLRSIRINNFNWFRPPNNRLFSTNLDPKQPDGTHKSDEKEIFVEMKPVAKEPEPIIDSAEALKLHQINRTSTSQKLPGEDQSASSFFRPYRIFYVIAAATVYVLMSNEIKCLRIYREIMDDLRLKSPKASAVLVDTRPRDEAGNVLVNSTLRSCKNGQEVYLIRMSEGHSTTLEELRIRHDKKVKKISTFV
jgi:hypothetical protein